MSSRLRRLGAVCVWIFKCFLRLRAWCGDLPGGRSSVERVWAALAAGGRACARPRAGPSHCAHVVRAAGGRVWWAPEVKVKSRASGGPLQRGVGPRRARSAAGPRAGRRCPGSLVAVVAVDGISPAWRYQAESPPLWSPSARRDTASPGRLAEPADSDEGSGTPHLCVGGSRATWPSPRAGRSRRRARRLREPCSGSRATV